MIQRILAVPVRLLFPEGLFLATLLVLPHAPELFALVEPRSHLLLAATVAAGLGIGWRFARGRVVHGLLILCAAAALPVLPTGSTAATLAALMVPLGLAAIALLPDRGIISRGGLLRAAGLAAPAGAIAALTFFGPASFTETGSDPLAAVAVPGLGVEVDSVAVAYGAALTALLVLALAARSAPARGALWATAGAFAAYTAWAGGATYVLAASGLVLVVSALEDAHALAYRDALTGLPSRRALDELLTRTARRYTLAMVDVDHFKAFNDKHGHDVGDQVLRMVASKLKGAGGGARAFRYGGEEFTLVFRGRSLQEAESHLERVRESVATAEFILRGPNRPKKKPKKAQPARRRQKKLSVTVSIGAAERNGRTADEVLKAADEALYEAKEAGRNQVFAAR